MATRFAQRRRWTRLRALTVATWAKGPCHISFGCPTRREAAVRYNARPRKNSVRFAPAPIMNAKSAPAIKNRQPRST